MTVNGGFREKGKDIRVKEKVNVSEHGKVACVQRY